MVAKMLSGADSGHVDNDSVAIRSQSSGSADDYPTPDSPEINGHAQVEEPNPAHDELCPLGAAKTRWYLCKRHPLGVVFRAGSGRLDSVANSCPACGALSVQFQGCACEYVPHPLDRVKRPGRRIVGRQTRARTAEAE